MFLRLVSGSRDCTIRVWDILDGQLCRTLYGHVAAVRCVQFDGKRVISGGYDCNIIVWDVDTGEILHVLRGHASRVYSLLVRFIYTYKNFNIIIKKKEAF